MSQEHTQGQASAVEFRILQELERVGPRTLDEFVRAFPEYTLNQVLLAVDRLSRDGALILRKPTPFQYMVEARNGACQLSRP